MRVANFRKQSVIKKKNSVNFYCKSFYYFVFCLSFHNLKSDGQKDLTFKINRNSLFPLKCLALFSQQILSTPRSRVVKLGSVSGWYIWAYNSSNLKKIIFLYHIPSYVKWRSFVVLGHQIFKYNSAFIVHYVAFFKTINFLFDFSLCLLLQTWCYL